ncbi:MAG: aminotransferase class I/II-fold pyridoxal phosphate-dependent enzyme [Nitrosopumilaceae archaeon]|nr:aminotransferase class I/II-fold pyridoxal phosphate-dependent enzyme [Nitrosopumilaceae archaeon]NIU00881.1 aminotransferase class I/II-fold pyridoxal phosphate-dependent enzyme [Nitrosopumilaceae archaeon]NIU87334.1 aminotransferase class I/II-fold pyridoxal phosphate-dependent enzyme [Nitrosopumilaceae archaeon]NIV65862.1 aminotransferase class I/II-fold pyridoxal phosphate-dependent enzyme [Nitrosopumilaceae archaeon]NIX61483.1 aminotransferase class I/II-fold pyridoxal phosphate-depende
MAKSSSNKEDYKGIFSMLKDHHKWFENSIPLIASENIPSPAVREAIISDFGNRYAEGWPGERVYAGCVYIDKVEFECMRLAKKLFKAKFADVRPISGVVANLAIYSAFSDPRDIMMAPSIPAGGHISHGKKEHSGTAGLVHGLNIEFYPFDAEEMTIDVDKTKQKIKDLEKSKRLPKIAMFGGSLFLFPHPVKELAEFLKNYNIHVNYDAAHVAGLIAGGLFQDPLREGADTMTMSTHKTLFGPQGGLILAQEKFGEAIKKATFPGLTSSHHIHHMAAKAIAFAEALEFGKSYAKQVIRNAKALAEGLNQEGFNVLGERRGYTNSHQIAVNVLDYSDGGKVEANLEKANIIVNRQLIPGDLKAGRNYFHPGGIRLGVSEITRLGMKETEMKEISNLIKQVVIDKKEPKKILNKVKSLRKQFQKVQFCFDKKLPAYEYIKLR